MIIKDGDFFYYTWKLGKAPETVPYWCRDARCVARTDDSGDIWLVDTYNYWPYKEGKEDPNIFTYEGLSREYSKYINTDLVDLNFICNLNEYRFIDEYTKNDYDGVVFVGYQCTKRWAVLKRSVKSNTAIIKKLQKELEDAIEKHEYAAFRIQQINKELLEVGS
mgnify:FL=1